MRKFWGFYDNGTYRVGCNGRTIYLYDQNNKELDKFRDVSYAYVGAFQPRTNIFVVKTTSGILAIYDLDKRKLLKKVTFAHVEGQDEGFAFSPNGEYFFNIEKPVYSTATQLTIYRTADYEVSNVLFSNNQLMVLDSLEFDALPACYVLGFMRAASGVIDYGFIGKLINNQITDIKPLKREEYDYIQAYKLWELSGYTTKKLEWSRLKGYPDKPHVSLKEVYDR